MTLNTGERMFWVFFISNILLLVSSCTDLVMGSSSIVWLSNPHVLGLNPGLEIVIGVVNRLVAPFQASLWTVQD